MSDIWRDTYDAWKLRSDRDEYLFDEEDADMDPETELTDFAAELTNLIARHLEAGAPADEIAAALSEAVEQLEGGDAEGEPEDEVDG